MSTASSGSRAGRYRGHLGYYDDDGGGVAFVYPWGLPPASYIVCRHSSMAKATKAEERLWWAVNANEIAARRLVKQLLKPGR